MKKGRQLLCFFISVLCFCTAPISAINPLASHAAEIVDSGTCGKDAVWQLDSDGTLTVSGTGAMYNISSQYTIPWADEKKLIKKVVISEGITNVGNQAFDGCKNLTDVTIADSVLTLNESAFSGCSALASVVIPNSVTRIGVFAFALCSSLTDITIPESVSSIGSLAFSGTPWLENEMEREPFVIINHILIFGRDMENADIPSGVTYIVSNAFWGHTEMQTLTIPDSVTGIEYNAFSGCSNLHSVILPASVKDLGMQAFVDCASLEEVTFYNLRCRIYDRENTIANDNKTYSGVIRGYDKSTADVYAAKYGCRFESLGTAPGDFNADGDLTVADAVLLARYLAEDDTLSHAEIDEILNGKPDRSNDGMLTVSDLSIFLNEMIAL